MDIRGNSLPWPCQRHRAYLIKEVGQPLNSWTLKAALELLSLSISYKAFINSEANIYIFNLFTFGRYSVHLGTKHDEVYVETRW